jgi:hypothetical protein
MWLLELLVFSFVIGTIIGLVWRFGEEWLEKRQMRKQLEDEILMGGSEEDIDNDTATTVAQPVNVVAPAPTTTGKSN